MCPPRVPMLKPYLSLTHQNTHRRCAGIKMKSLWEVMRISHEGEHSGMTFPEGGGACPGGTRGVPMACSIPQSEQFSYSKTLDRGFLLKTKQNKTKGLTWVTPEPLGGRQRVGWVGEKLCRYIWRCVLAGISFPSAEQKIEAGSWLQGRLRDAV